MVRTVARFPSFFDPFAQFRVLEERLRELFPVVEEGRDKPRTNVWVGKDTAVLAVELPGVGADAIDVRVEGRVVTIAVEGRERTLLEGESLGRAERRRGAFDRSFEFPYGLDEAKVRAEYKAGLLTITLPRAESEKPRKITVRS